MFIHALLLCGGCRPFYSHRNLGWNMNILRIGSPTSVASIDPSQDTDGNRVMLRDIHWLNFGWGEDSDPHTGRKKSDHVMVFLTTSMEESKDCT